MTFDCESPQMDFFRNAIFSLFPENKKILSIILEEVNHTFSFNKKEKRLELLANHSFGGEQMIHLYLEMFLLSLIRTNSKNLSSPQNVHLQQEEVGNTAIKLVINLLENNIYGNITLSEIADQLNFGKTYLSSLFKKVMHCTIMQYYYSLKITEAKNLLKSSSLSISEIAEKLGYDTPSYFCKTFRKYCLISPKQYRQSISPDEQGKKDSKQHDTGVTP